MNLTPHPAEHESPHRLRRSIEEAAEASPRVFGPVDFRNAFLCVTIFIGCLLLAWPFADISFNDDWTWAFTVLKLWQTGHLIYNGWSSPSVISQAYWGLLWVKAFGFSFNILRISTIPMAATSIGLCYALAVHAGLRRRIAVFVSLMLGLSPIFLPLAATFMSDVPGLCFLLFSLYAMVRGSDSRRRSAAIGWIVAAVIAALVGGSSRQVVWIAPLAVLPYFCWLGRKDKTTVVTCVLGWLTVLAGATATQEWFLRQPYALPDPPLSSYLRYAFVHPAHLARGMFTIGLTMALLILPSLVGRIRARPGSRRVIAVLVFIALLGVTIRLGLTQAPWMQNMLTKTGILGCVELSGDRPVFITPPLGRLLTCTVLIAVSFQLTSILLRLKHPGVAARQCWSFFVHPKPGNHTVPALLITLLSLILLEMTRCVFDVAYDRHLLPMIPLLTIPMLWLYQQEGMRQMPAIAWAMLALFAIYSVAATQEVSSLQRARVIAVSRLTAANVKPTETAAGFEQDWWTELQVNGHINDARIQNPPHSYRPGLGATPSIRPIYALQSEPTSDTAETRFGFVDYLSFLPPFHRRIYITRYLDPWWLDPTRAATRPTRTLGLPQSLLDQYAPRPQ